VLLWAGIKSVRRSESPWVPTRRFTGSDGDRRMVAQARWSVAVVGAMALGGFLTLVLASRSALPDSAEEIQALLGREVGGVDPATPTITDFQANWPRFRGWDGGGTTSREFRFGFQTGDQNVAWKSPVPASGFNSPVVWGDRVFISGGDANLREVFCYAATDGVLLWRRAVQDVPGSPAEGPEIPEMTGYAASTMATDGERVFVLFANGDLAALRFDGSVAWARYLGPLQNMYGHASSLAVWPGTLIAQLDQDEDAPGGSKLLAFEAATGRVRWEQGKPTHGSWVTPIVIEGAGVAQIVSLALPFIMSHALADGSELWRAPLLGGELTPSPVLAGDRLVVVSPVGDLYALPMSDSGTARPGVVWTNHDNIPDITSPVSDGSLVYTVTSMGEVAAMDLENGSTLWKHDLEFLVQASPAIAGSELLVLGVEGDLVVLATGRRYEERGRLKLEDTFHASPAFADGNMYLRGGTNLWCLRTPKEVADAH